MFIKLLRFVFLFLFVLGPVKGQAVSFTDVEAALQEALLFESGVRAYGRKQRVKRVGYRCQLSDVHHPTLLQQTIEAYRRALEVLEDFESRDVYVRSNWQAEVLSNVREVAPLRILRLQSQHDALPPAGRVYNCEIDSAVGRPV